MKVKKGDTVQVHYKGTLSDGTIFDNSEGRDPLSFTLGQNHVIPGFEKATEGMSIGETKTIHIPSNEAYGDVLKDGIIDIKVGERLVLLHPETGEPIPVILLSAENGILKLDANHPLAGKDLTFEITLHSIGEKTECCQGGGCCTKDSC